jgi:hypothetical protein
MTAHVVAPAVLLCLVVPLFIAPAAARELPRLKVSDNGRFLVTEQGRPFFWLGDTAWSIRRISPPDVDLYLSTRARQGFTLIQIAPASSAGYGGTDYAGNQPFDEGDADRPNEAFWKNIDSVIDKARDRGLHVMIFPLWGHDYNRTIGTDREKAYRLGLWLGRRYRSRGNVVWSVSGEYDSINDFRLPISEAQKNTFNAVARGLREGHGSTQLMSIHPGAAITSSLDFHQEAWLSFNMLQSGHVADREAYGMPEVHALIAHDYVLTPTKPVYDGEPMYEDTPDAVWIRQSVEGPRVGADVMRRKAYWAVFAGAFGHTYGHNDLYCFYDPAHPEQVGVLPGQRGYWKEALQAPGGAQMHHLRALMESRPFLTRIPDQSLIAGDTGEGVRHVQATRDASGSYALIYVPTPGQTVTVDTSKLSGKRLKAWWYDPRTGKATALKGDFPVGGKLEFAAPPEGPDWVLVLDDAARRFGPPGGRGRP